MVYVDGNSKLANIAHGLRNEMHFSVNWLWTYLY